MTVVALCDRYTSHSMASRVELSELVNNAGQTSSMHTVFRLCSAKFACVACSGRLLCRLGQPNTKFDNDNVIFYLVSEL